MHREMEQTMTNAEQSNRLMVIIISLIESVYFKCKDTEKQEIVQICIHIFIYFFYYTLYIL